MNLIRFAPAELMNNFFFKPNLVLHLNVVQIFIESTRLISSKNSPKDLFIPKNPWQWYYLFSFNAYSFNCSWYNGDDLQYDVIYNDDNYFIIIIPKLFVLVRLFFLSSDWKLKTWWGDKYKFMYNRKITKLKHMAVVLHPKWSHWKVKNHL